MGRSRFGFTDWDVEDRPQVVIWEATRACALACRHCRASAQRRRAPDELDGSEGQQLLRQVANMRPQIFVITGGDPLEREDLFDLLGFASDLGLGFSLSPSATPRLDQDAVWRLAAQGCRGVQLSLDGADAATHDRFRGHPGTFARTLQACRWVREAGIGLTVATTVARHNVEQLNEIYGLVQSLDPVRWSLFFLVPTGRARAQEMVPPEVAEAIMVWLKVISAEAPFIIKTTEAPQVRRLFASSAPAETATPTPFVPPPPVVSAAGATVAATPPAPVLTPPARGSGGITDGKVTDVMAGAAAAGTSATFGPAPTPARGPATIGDGRGFLFIAANGDICPSGFLPLPAGNARQDDILEVYRHHPVFRSLRDPAALHGPRCGRCAYRGVCGGSRSRAFAVYGDPLGDDPLCAYVPPEGTVNSGCSA